MMKDNIVKTGESCLRIADGGPSPAEPRYVAGAQAHSFTPLISTFAGDDWRKMSDDIFTYVLPAGQNPPDEAGFRIRLSVHPALAEDALRTTLPIIVSEGCAFKVIANTALLELASSRSAAGKKTGDFMTVFPASEELFDDLTVKLQDATQGIESTYISPQSESNVRTALTLNNPWPGFDSYLPGEHAFFCGREEEQSELERRHESAPVTVLSGQPGVGKTSFMRAGLQPAFERAGYEPIYLRLQWAGAAHPLQQVRDEINRVLRERQIDGAPFGEGQSLREYFHRQGTGLGCRRWQAGGASLDFRPIRKRLYFGWQQSCREPASRCVLDSTRESG